MTTSDSKSEQLIVDGYSLVEPSGRIIATVAKDLPKQPATKYLQLFSAAPNLLKALENLVSIKVESIERNKPKPTLTGFRAYTDGPTFPTIPEWLTSALKVLAVVYGEKITIGTKQLGLSIAKRDSRALNTADGHLVLQLSQLLSAQSSAEYLRLFLAAPAMLEILEGRASEWLKSVQNEHDSVISFDATKADEYPSVIPEQLRLLYDLISKAKGAVPISNRYKNR